MKKVIVHGTAESLKKFFSERITEKKYKCLAILSDGAGNIENSPVKIIEPENLPPFVYDLVDAIVLTNKDTRQNDIEYFRNLGVEPKKIICWNPEGWIEHFTDKLSDGTEVFYMEGLEFHIRNSDDEKFFREVRRWLYTNNQFYMLSAEDYPQKDAEFYKRMNGKTLGWNNLTSFSEKMQWLKLYDNTPIKTRLSDKFLVRNFVIEKIGNEYLVPLLGVWDNFDEIDFEALPNQFILKCNHGSTFQVICRDKNNFDFEKAREKMNAFMKINYGALMKFELNYLNIKRKIIAQKFMIDGNNPALNDYKFLCFDGQPIYCQCETNRTTIPCADYFDMNWTHMDFEQTNMPNNPHYENIAKPKNFELMKKFAAILSKDFVHVRVDFFEVNGELYFAEITFANWAGNNKFKDLKIDEHLGNFLHLPNEKI